MSATVTRRLAMADVGMSMPAMVPSKGNDPFAPV